MFYTFLQSVTNSSLGKVYLGHYSMKQNLFISILLTVKFLCHNLTYGQKKEPLDLNNQYKSM